MPLSFPSNPSINQTVFTGGRVWVYNGSGWVTSSEPTANLQAVPTSIVPSANVTYDLGTVNNRWRDIYLSGNTIDLGGTAIKSSANGVSFTDSVNPSQLVSLQVAEIKIGTGANVLAITPSNATIEYDRHYNYPGTLTVNTGTLRWYIQGSTTVKKIRAQVTTVSSGANITLGIRKNTILAANISIPQTVNAAVINTNIQAVDGEYFTVDILSVGSTTNGSDLVVSFSYTKGE